MFMYKLEIQGDYPSTLWNHVFQMMSLESFNQLYSFLRFPIKPTKKVQQIAQDFVVAVTKEAGITIPFKASQDLLPGESITSKRHQMLFDKTFDLLRQEGVAKEIHEWAMTTQDYYRLEERDRLLAWTRILREYFILAYPETKSLSVQKPLNTNLKKTTDHWTSMWNQVKYLPTFDQLHISRDNANFLRETVLKSETEKLQFVDTMFSIPLKHDWDTLVLEIFFSRTWINLEAKLRINVEEWNLILDRLDDREIEIIHEWGRLHSSRYRNLLDNIPKLDFGLHI